MVSGLSSKFVPAANRTRGHGTTQLQDEVPGLRGPKDDVQTAAPLSDEEDGDMSGGRIVAAVSWRDARLRKVEF